MADQNPSGWGVVGASPPGDETDNSDVEAYESDWYRSLKALAARQVELRGDEDEEESPEPSAASEEPPTPEEPPADASSDAVVIDLAAKAEAPAELEPTPAEPTEPEVVAPEVVEHEVIEPEVKPEVVEPKVVEPKAVEPEVVEPEPAAAESEPAPPKPEPTPAQPEPKAAEPEPTPAEPEPTPAEPEPTPAEPEPAAPPAPPAPTGASLDSTDANVRREALVELAAQGLEPSQVERVLQLAMDPDQGVRRQALSTLTVQADELPDANVQQALHDPSDEVRAQAVELAAARGDRDLIHLLPLLSVRRSPLTQAAALQAIPDLVAAGGGPTEEQFTTALHAVADLESTPNDDERQPLTELARGIGVGRIAEVLGVGDDRHLGACRLLWVEGSVAALRGLAAQLGDPIEEIRNMATQAQAKVEEMEAAAAPPPPAPVGSSPVEQALDAETILRYAQALEDPEDAVREPATAALNAVDRSAITAWAVNALHGEDPEVAKLGAEVVGLRGLSDAVADVLDRGASVQGERQEPYRTALAALSIDAETLVGALSSVAPERRAHAVHLLWDAAQREALPLLERSLNDPSPEVRTAVLEVLGSSGEPGVMEAAGRVLAGDSASVVRAAAIGVLAHGTDEQRVASLSQALSDPDPVVRAEATSMLPVGLAREAIEPISRALNDLDERVWRAALPHLASFRSEDLSLVWTVLTRLRPEQRESFIAALEHADAGKVSGLALEHVQSPDPQERELALTLAGRGSSEACVQACVAALQDPAAPVRLAAAASLGTLRSPGSVKALGASLSDPDAAVRVAAVHSLGVIDSEAVLGFLVMALQDPSNDVREASSLVLTEWSSPAVARRLAGVLATPALEQQATDLLVKMGSSATELLVDVLLHSRKEMRPTVGRLLERIVGTDHFAARLGSTDPHQRRRAMIAVGGIGGPSAVELALRALGDPDQGVRVAALEALGELGDPRTADQVARCSESDPVPDVVEAARQALSKLRPGT